MRGWVRRVFRTVRTHALIAVPVAGVAACVTLAGLDDIEYATGAGAGGTGGVAGGGAAAGHDGGGGASVGGSGGEGGATLAPSDWTNSFEAVLRFELPPPDLGFDSTGNHVGEFIERAQPTLDPTRFVEGSGSMAVSSSGLERNAPLSLSSFTVGGWFYVDQDPSGDIAFIFAWTSALEGMSLERQASSGALRCYAGDGATHSAGGASWPIGAWIHVSCSLDGTSGELTAYADGVGGTPQSGASVVYPLAPLEIPDAGQAYVGNMDELFFHGAALPPSSVTRIYACGITGSGCQCDPSDPAAYLDCGRASNCGNLPACDRPAP